MTRIRPEIWIVPLVFVAILLCEASAGGLWRVGAPQWENALAEKHWDAKWTYLESVSQLPGVNDITLSVMNIDGEREGAGVNILTASPELQAEWALYIRLADEAKGIGTTLYLSEWEHNGVLSLADRLEITRMAIEVLRPLVEARRASVSPRGPAPILVIGEEYDDSLDAARSVAVQIRKFYGSEEVLIGIHNPHSGISRERCLAIARELRGLGLLDVLLFQGDAYDVGKTASSIGIPTVAHELKGGHDPNNGSEFQQWAMAPGTIGFSVYTEHPQCRDQLCNDPSIFAARYRELDATRRVQARARVLYAISLSPWMDVNGDGRVDAADF